jgi:diaminopimelate epimerase
MEAGRVRLALKRWPDMVRAICDRRSGIGADGVLRLSAHRDCDGAIDICNADGSWAEKSGNGLRLAVMHYHLQNRRRRRFELNMDRQIHRARIVGKTDNELLVETTLGEISFEADRVPVRSPARYMINTPLEVDGLRFPVTCLSVGNPHAVVMVEDFDFDWHRAGRSLEIHPAFPNHTNVEFVKVLNRKRLKVAEWERGAGATGSSGTGAVAAVCTAAKLGLADRKCEAEFETGSLHVHWNAETGLVELTGPAALVGYGEFEYRC